MEQHHIVKPSITMAKAYETFLADYLLDKQRYYTMLRELHEAVEGNVEEIIAIQQAWSRGERLQEGWFPVTTLWLMSKDQIAGEAVIRHGLNQVLEEYAGHVTYYVLPGFRGKGLGKAILRGVRDEARELGIDNLLICCDENNVPSRKLIESCGGKLIDIFDNREAWGEMTCRYSLITGANLG